MLTAKNKKILMTIGAIFGAVVLAAAFFRSKATAEKTGAKLQEVLTAELKSLVEFKTAA